MRGHQYPMAFLSIASGLDLHGASSQHPISYCHVDMAGVMGGKPSMGGRATGRPVVAMAGFFGGLAARRSEAATQLVRPQTTSRL